MTKKPIKKNKFNSKKVEINGHKFDSVAESEFYKILVEKEKKGEIMNLELQPRFELQEGFKTRSKKAIRKIEYVADFQYLENDKMLPTVVDVKGQKTDVYQLKKKLFLHKYQPFVFFKEVTFKKRKGGYVFEEKEE